MEFVTGTLFNRGQVSKIRTTVTDIDLVFWKVHSRMYNALGERET